MLSQAQSRQRLCFTENAALLSRLSEAPAASHANPWPTTLSDQDHDRVLSREREADLTATLAYLSGISDNPSHVVATCVEELSGGRGIRVVVAVNKECPSSGNDILARIKSGLERIFSCLASINNVDSGSEDLVLDAVADMCRHRIFSRLRSRRPDANHMKTGRAYFGSLIQNVINGVNAHSRSYRSQGEIESFLNDAGELLRWMASLEACQDEEVVYQIKRVLRAAHRLNRTTNIAGLFSQFTASQLDPSMASGFISRIAKLARYQECSQYLCRTAQELNLLQNVQVTIVSLDSNLFSRNISSADVSLDSCLSRCQNGAPTVFRAEMIKGRLGTDDSAFVSKVRTLLCESRVHAEIQIVCQYEVHPVARKPRVICSSKDACYLCNLFIKLHGTFHIPKSHGNFYSGWRLLPLPALDHIQGQLNKHLEAQIRDLLPAAMRDPRQRLPHPKNPNESTVFKFSAPLSSLPSSPTRQTPPQTSQTSPPPLPPQALPTPSSPPTTPNPPRPRPTPLPPPRHHHLPFQAPPPHHSRADHDPPRAGAVAGRRAGRARARAVGDTPPRRGVLRRAPKGVCHAG
ncbi:hypothetical protein C8A05DRAFT_13526 [Staphylotrichum tortipilum]|uniref:Uncharacterized protein n=1 Tax=Staphylotrichum tortipilum TaxID=2831512 RepID=A0AAN6RWF2_9PEZI|nr:hypothetical protein C8A05DRAFT_13526 [Staphylotrichum longicolle]